MRSIGLRVRLGLGVCLLGIATSSKAARLQFDATPAGDAVKAALAMVGVPVPVRICGPAGNVTGSLDFTGPVDLAQSLRRLGADVVFTGQVFNVGCDRAMARAKGVQPTPASLQAGGVPSSSIPLGSPIAGMAAGLTPQDTPPAGPPAPPPEPPPPPTTEVVQAHYTIGKRILELMQKLPGLAVLAEPERVGPIAFTGSKVVVRQAIELFKAIDRCPTKVEVQASILVQERSLSTSRGFGVQLRLGGNDFMLGNAVTPSGVAIDIPQLRAFIDAAKDRAGLVQLSTLGGQVSEGEELSLNDGGEVPIQTGTTITPQSTQTNVTYRKTGDTLTIKVDAVGDFIVGQLTHELSTVGTATALGPTFGTRSTRTVFRLRPFEPLALSLSGLDGGSDDKRKGLLSSSVTKSRQTNSAVLVLALRPLSCQLETAGVDPLRPAGSDLSPVKLP